HEVFGLQMPKTCPGVPSEVLDPRRSWKDAHAYDAKAQDLAARFNRNFKKFEDKASEALREAAPQVLEAIK
ncbi:MAG: phosphoenolpyruvate carboxykinase (ATP), partial [Phaeodactylibacter sp.]|nr:phosphoenolpyruvate carboxykinase (ATP) [Phaeodactylibacter sp.]